MFKAMTAGLAAAAILAAAGPALAAGPLYVTTDFDTLVAPGDPFKADLASIGVTSELASPTQIEVLSAANLTFKLLRADRNPNGPRITNLVVDGVDYAFDLQGFTSPGTLLGTQSFSGDFADLVGFRDADMPSDVTIPWPDGFQVYIRGADVGNLSGIGPFIGYFDTLYFSIGGLALFEVSVAGVPEPQTWVLMIGGFALAGGVLRRRRVMA